MDASDSQRAGLSQLGYGVLGVTQADPASASALALNEDDLVAAERAKSDAARAQFVRTSALVQAGVMSRNKLGAAEAAAQTAAKELRERENLIQSAKAGPKT
jgi:multidrug resistance efflux pump